LIFISAAFFV